MDGAAELARLADLLRIGAETARKIAALRPWNADRIDVLAAQADEMAVELDAMSMTTAPAPDVSR